MAEQELQKKLKGASADEAEKLRKDHDEYVEKLKKTAQGIVKRFLARHFRFNPDHHLRTAHTENAKDPERVSKDVALKKLAEASERAKTIDSKLSASPSKTYEYLRSNLLATYQSAVKATETLKATLSVLLDPAVSTDDKQGILLKKYRALSDICSDMKKIVEPIAAAETVEAWTVNPPVDVFHQFNRYVTNHYEQLREAVTALYDEKPDFEYAVIYYNSFKTPDAAREHRVQHENDFRTEVLTIENSGVTMLGPFKENRGRIDFYNKNTEIMKRMMDQIELDHKLGKDLMEKVVKKKKKQNIEESGPDAPRLAEYSRAVSTVQELGAKQILTKEEKEKLAAAAAVKEDFEVPENAIQVDMFCPVEDKDGELKLQKTKFYTQAEAPLHLQEGSPYHTKYQPKRTDNEGSLEQQYRRKVLIGKDGSKKEIMVPIDEKDE